MNRLLHSLSRMLLLAALFCIDPMTVRADDEAEPIQVTRTDAYRQLRRGDELRERRQWAEAAYAYQTALERYRLLARNAPAWEQDYYRFRIGYCERELAMITRTTGRSIEDWLAERDGATRRPEAEPYRERYEAMLEENRYLRNQLEELRDELAMFYEMEEIELEREQRRQRTQPDRREQPPPEARERPQPVPIPEAVRDPVPPRPEPREEQPVPRRQPTRPALDAPVPMR